MWLSKIIIPLRAVAVVAAARLCKPPPTRVEVVSQLYRARNVMEHFPSLLG